MLKISKQQMGLLEAAALERFVNEMVPHLQSTFPEECEGLPEFLLRDSILRGITRAESYGIVNARDVCLYLGLVLVYGEGFEQRLPWASEILRDPWYLDPTSRIDALYEAALERESDERL
jgi:hypothetical protein